METKRLRQFCLIVEAGSLIKAAQLLHISHSGLSKSMKLLQEELGYLLFCPSGRGLALTKEGIQIYQRAKEFLSHEDHLFKLEEAIRPSTLRIGTREIFLLSMIEQLRCIPFKNTSITFINTDPGDMEQLLANRQIDYGVTYAPFPSENINITEIGKYRLGCYHLRQAFKGLDLIEIPFAVPVNELSNHPLGIKQRDGWTDTTCQRNKKYYVDLLSSAIELTLQGLCAIYIPDFVAKKINNSHKTKYALIEHPLPKKQTNFQTAYLLNRKDDTDTDMLKKIHSMIKNTITPN